MKTIEIDRIDGKARLGRLSTGHGQIDTPVFMPVGTQGVVKAMTHLQLKDLGVKMILANAYHLYLRPGDELIKRMGGLHRFCGWDGAMLTDSGGYQIFSLGVLREIKEDGVLFQSHIDGSRHFLTPEKMVHVQENIGADVAMCLDECVSYPSTSEYTRDSVELTTRWAKRCLQAKTDSPQKLFGIIQGGFYPELRIRSAHDILALDFDGFAIGGLSVGEPKSLMWDMVDTVIDLMPADKPRYMMGIGLPEDLLEGVKRGIDMFDCIIPTRFARNGSLFTWDGRINIKNARFTEDKGPIDEECSCYTCRTYSRAYLRHLVVSHELTSFYLNTVHNVHFYMELMRRVRDALENGTFGAFYHDFKLRYEGGESDDRCSVCNG
ncbi:MAG: tRNA guanosine(34) transglycosylase Tgt [Syntrophorhabdaceae bacterium]|nr:tRNA guanosine(34) transglycosylase Tgt [Syntrophorhabdaceae bacterium]MDD4196896.1 tRNA guanosine(34) transglycosylase Tgt [Syntrophorhabdaceae bacterium]